MREEQIFEYFQKLKNKRKLTDSEKKYMYALADALMSKYGWNINDEAFLGMYEDDDEWYVKFRKQNN